MHKGNGEDEADAASFTSFCGRNCPAGTFEDAAPNWRLEEDLGLYGDEAVDFLSRFAERFNVMAGFEVDQYFRREIDMLSNFFRTLLLSWTGKQRRKASLTIADLEEAVRTAKLKP